MQREDLIAAINDSLIVCMTRCWACKIGDHFDTPQWHTWADTEDVAHAKATDQADPRKSRCCCDCADAPKPADVIRLPHKPVPPARTEYPLRKTTARLRWLDAVAAGSVQASSCDVWTKNAHELVWYVSSADTRMTRWLGHPDVYRLWVPTKRTFAGSRGKHIIRLTVEGKRLLGEWRRS